MSYLRQLKKKANEEATKTETKTETKTVNKSKESQPKEPKSFNVNRNLSKDELIISISKTIKDYKNNLPIEYFRNLYLQVQLMSHRKSLKKPQKKS